MVKHEYKYFVAEDHGLPIPHVIAIDRVLSDPKAIPPRPTDLIEAHHSRAPTPTTTWSTICFPLPPPPYLSNLAIHKIQYYAGRQPHEMV